MVGGQVILWVDEACKAWGRCTRWMMKDTGEGFPNADVIQKAREGRLSTGEQTALTQHFGEVRVGQSLEIARALNMRPYVPELLQAILWAQYVFKLRSKAKVRARIEAVEQYMGEDLSLAEYWRNVDRLHYYLASRLMFHVEPTPTVGTRKSLIVETNATYPPA